MPPKKKNNNNNDDGGGGGKLRGSRVNVRHILCEKQSKLNQAIERLNNGEDFASVARDMSEDKARAGGSLGWFSKGAMDKSFEDVAFSTPIGEISPPFKSPHGWHVLKVDDRQ